MKQPGAAPQEPSMYIQASAESAIHSTALFGYRPSMAQSLSKVVIHVIFSTKDHYPWLDANVRPRMHAYLATICRDAGAEVFRIGGVADHVHVVTTLPRTLSQADMLEGITKKSSKWIKSLGSEYRRFYWQRGYGAFSVSPSQLDALLRYVETQEEHHRSRTFQEEYREFLRKHGVEYDERYVWE
ncbi:MAG: transposase [Terrimicrobiaceae bacterium]